LNALIDGGTCNLRFSIKKYSSLKGAYRFLSNPKVQESELVRGMSADCSRLSKGREVVVLADTTSIDTTHHRKRLTDLTGLGRVLDTPKYESIGFFAHACLAYDKLTRAPLGVPMVHLWNRSLERTTQSKMDKRHIPIEEKESNRWLADNKHIRDEVLSAAKHITLVMDRESDIIEVLHELPNERCDIILRAQHNRKIDINGKKSYLLDHIKSSPIKGNCQLEIKAGHSKRKARIAKMNIKFGEVLIRYPKRHPSEKRKANVKMNYVEIRENVHQGYRQEPILSWVLLTSKQVKDNAMALEIIKEYQSRWRIEEFFKLIKSDGFNIEKTELKKGQSIRKLTLLVMEAAIKIQQLKAARHGETNLKVIDVFNDHEIICLKMLNKKLQGNTKKQSNPYPESHLAWAAWVVARLGGWKDPYDKRRPPGARTFARGLEKLDVLSLFEGNIFEN